MKKWRLLLFAALVLFALPNQAKACEPCEMILSLEDTAAQADLIVVARHDKDGPPSDNGEGWGGPEWIEIEVLEVYKGEPTGEIIRVNSWSGMCPYGIIISDIAEHLVFLKETPGAYGGVDYDAVNYGCAVKELPVQEGRVIIGDQALPIADLAADLGLTPPELPAAQTGTVTVPPEDLIDQTEIEAPPPGDQNDPASPGPCPQLGLGLILAPLVVVWWVKRKRDTLTPDQDTTSL